MKVYNRLLSFAIAFTLLFLPVVAQAKGFSGGSSSSSSRSSSSVHSSSSSNSGTYHSGYKAPSSSVQSKQPSYNNNSANTTQSKPRSGFSSFFSHAAAFGAGAFLGNMFHPFGGYGYGGMGVGHGFSLFGLLADILVIALIVWVFRRIFARR
ncbi:hypothetical protein [Ectobacillus polymachus]|uniref:hypothetical protein n=1 Tax=Ectobacillus polymachus TaxID=1508806 RepID=UPI003A86C4D6